MTDAEQKAVMDELLALYDWHVRDASTDYEFGYADAIGQAILNIGKVLGEELGKKPYKFEAYKRVAEYTNRPDYWEKYPTPLSKVYPAEIIRKRGGKL